MSNPVNALFITTQGAYARKDHDTVVVSVDHQERTRVPLSAISSVVCFGRVMMTPDLMAHLAESDIGVAFLSEGGHFRCRVVGETHGNVLLRRAQYRAADDPTMSLRIACNMLLGKLQGCREVLRRALADHGDESSVLSEAMQSLGGSLRSLSQAADVESIRGSEGAAAATYFGVFDHLLSAQREDFRFEKRTRRPPLNRVNALLSFAYTLLQHDCSGALEAVGLDPQVGFLHEERSGRPSLALDLMEEFRAPLADRLVLSLINRRQIQASDFLIRESGAVEMTDEARKLFIVEYQKKKAESLIHPLTEEDLCWGLMPHVQARLLARVLRGDLPEYPAFMWR